MIRQISNNMINLSNGHTLNSLISNKGELDPVLKSFVPTLISHEVPKSMLTMSRGFNDYDYALVHLFKDNPDYFEFYKESVDMGRMVILDNSLYELGEAFDMKEYAEWIKKLNPTYYILPDAFWDSGKTINLAMEWMVNYGKYIDPKIKRIGVAQGSTYNEIKNSYKFLEQICDCIAFTFKFNPTKIRIDQDINLCEFLEKFYVRYFENVSTNGMEISGKDLTFEDEQAVYRYLILKQLDEDGVINYNRKHHLLGLQNTTLLFESCLFPWVTSIDTSNPIICGFKGNAYYFNETIMNGVNNSFIGNSGHKKPMEQLKDFFYIQPSEPIWSNSIETVMYNIKSFRNIVNPPHISAIYYQCLEFSRQIL